jgi:hypothetical protein
MPRQRRNGCGRCNLSLEAPDISGAYQDVIPVRLQPLPPALGAAIAAQIRELGRGLGVIRTLVIW